MTIKDAIGSNELLKSRVAYRIWLKFRQINRFELSTILALDNFLLKQEREVIGKAVFAEFVTGNRTLKFKLYGYIEGLLNKGFLGSYEYVKRPNSLAIGISDLGRELIKSYYIEFERMNREQTKRYAKVRKSKRGKYILKTAA